MCGLSLPKVNDQLTVDNVTGPVSLRSVHSTVQRPTDTRGILPGLCKLLVFLAAVAGSSLTLGASAEPAYACHGTDAHFWNITCEVFNPGEGATRLRQCL